MIYFRTVLSIYVINYTASYSYFKKEILALKAVLLFFFQKKKKSQGLFYF